VAVFTSSRRSDQLKPIRRYASAIQCGGTKVAHLDDSPAAADVEFTSDELREIDRASRRSTSNGSRCGAQSHRDASGTTALVGQPSSRVLRTTGPILSSCPRLRD